MSTSTAITHHGHQHHIDSESGGITGAVAVLALSVGRRQVSRFVVDLAGVSVGERVLDIGSGPGMTVREASRRGADAIGVDPSPAMLRSARRRTHRVGRTAEFLQGAAESIPVPDGWATVAWALSSAHHWDDVDAGLAEAQRVIAPGGKLFVVERVATGRGFHGRHGFTRAQAEHFAQRMVAAGFVDVAVDERSRRHTRYLVIRGKRA